MGGVTCKRCCSGACYRHKHFSAHIPKCCSRRCLCREGNADGPEQPAGAAGSQCGEYRGVGEQNDIELLGQVSCSPGASTLSFRARERKLRTRRLILMGSYREHVT